MAKYMREVFGTKPEPWKKLPEQEKASSLTVTVELGGTSPTAKQGPHTGLVQAAGLVAKLDNAPDLFRRRADTPIDWAQSGSASAGTPLPPKRLPIALVLIGAVVVVGAIAAVIYFFLLKSHGAPPTASTAPRDAAVAIAPADAAPADAAAVDSAEIDAGAAPARTLADEVQAGNWGRALELCASSPPANDDDREHCAIAACSRGDRGPALAHPHASSHEHQLAIEAACRKVGVELAPKQPKKDPCKNPAYVKA